MGVPGVVDPVDASVSLATNVAGIEGARFAGRLADALQIRVRLENDINLAALGEQWRGVARGVDDFLFLSIGTGMGAGLVLRRELHRGRNGAAGELDYAFIGVGPDLDPCAGAVALFAEELAARHSGATSLLRPFEPRPIFAAARAGDSLAREIVAEEHAASRCMSFPSRPSPTSSSWSSAAGSARTATCCSSRSGLT